MRTFVNSITRWDTVWLTAIFGLEGRRLISALMPRVSKSGDGYWYPLLALALIVRDPQTGWSFLSMALAAFAIELPLYKLIKQTIKRDRPCEALAGVHSRLAPSDAFSFPSGHTAAAFVMATVLVNLFPTLAPLAFLWAVTVGFSRIYLGVHYPTDVLAGMVIGILSGICGAALAG